MHSSLALNLSGTPIGLTAAKFWTRKKFKGSWALRRHVNPTRVPIETKESYRWLENLRQSMALLGRPERYIHVGDRESDIYELLCPAEDLGTNFLIRVQANRLASRLSGSPAPTTSWSCQPNVLTTFSPLIRDASANRRHRQNHK